MLSQISQFRILLTVFLHAQLCRNNAFELSDLVTDRDLNILLLTETWLKELGDEAQKAEMTPSGYLLKSFCWEDEVGGGFAFLIKKIKSKKKRRRKKSGKTRVQLADELTEND